MKAILFKILEGASFYELILANKSAVYQFYKDIRSWLVQHQPEGLTKLQQILKLIHVKTYLEDVFRTLQASMRILFALRALARQNLVLAFSEDFIKWKFTKLKKSTKHPHYSFDSIAKSKRLTNTTTPAFTNICSTLLGLYYRYKKINQLQFFFFFFSLAMPKLWYSYLHVWWKDNKSSNRVSNHCTSFLTPFI